MVKRNIRRVAQFGSAFALGAKGRGFESLHADQNLTAGKIMKQTLGASVGIPPRNVKTSIKRI